MYYKIFKISEGISLIQEIYVANFMRCNIWHVRGKEFDLIIDTGMGLSSLKKFIIDDIDKPIISVITHSHFDHCGSLHEFENRLGHKSEAKIIQNMRNEDIVFSGAWKEIQIIDKVKFPNYEGNTFHVTPTTLTGFLDEGDVIDLGNRTFKILHLPGHSPGSIGLLDTKSKELFSGDALYDGELLDEFYHSDKTLFKNKKILKIYMHLAYMLGFGVNRDMHGEKNDWVNHMMNYLENKTIVVNQKYGKLINYFSSNIEISTKMLRKLSLPICQTLYTSLQSCRENS